MRKVLFLILTGLCLVGCKNSPVRGYVVGKSFVPAHNTTNYDVILKKPMVKSVPDQWIVWVADSCRDCEHSYDWHEKNWKGELFMCKCPFHKNGEYSKFLSDPQCSNFKHRVKA